MKIDILLKLSARLLFGIAALTIAVAFLESLAQLLGFSIVGRTYTAGRLLELAAMLLVFVIAVRLREILAVLRGQNRRTD